MNPHPTLRVVPDETVEQRLERLLAIEAEAVVVVREYRKRARTTAHMPLAKLRKLRDLVEGSTADRLDALTVVPEGESS